MTGVKPTTDPSEHLVSEFVVFDEHGREPDWIDPVAEFTETDERES